MCFALASLGYRKEPIREWPSAKCTACCSLPKEAGNKKMLSQIFLQQLRPFFRAGVMSFHISATLLLDSAAITGKFLSISVLRSIHWSVLLQSEFCFVLRTWRAPHQHLYFWTWRGRGCKVPQILPTQTQSSFNATSAFEASRTASIFPSSEWMPHVFFVCFLFWFWFWLVVFLRNWGYREDLKTEFKFPFYKWHLHL